MIKVGAAIVEKIIVDDRKIWWLASYPKSGNTWVRMFVNAYKSGYPIDINSPYHYVTGDTRPAIFQACYCRPADNLTLAEEMLLRPATLITAISMSVTKDLCLKTHHAKAVTNQIPLFPVGLSAGAVYLIRDPRDVVISYAKHLGDTIDNMIEHMNSKQYVGVHEDSNLHNILLTWSLHVSSWTEKNEDIPTEAIRYEDLLADPRKEFRKILPALGIKETDERRFDFALEQSSFANLKGLESKNGFREKCHQDMFFDTGKHGRWKDILTQSQVDKIEGDQKDTMKKFGYL